MDKTNLGTIELDGNTYDVTIEDIKETEEGFDLDDLTALGLFQDTSTPKKDIHHPMAFSKHESG